MLSSAISIVTSSFRHTESFQCVWMKMIYHILIIINLFARICSAHHLQLNHFVSLRFRFLLRWFCCRLFGRRKRMEHYWFHRWVSLEKQHYARQKGLSSDSLWWSPWAQHWFEDSMKSCLVYLICLTTFSFSMVDLMICWQYCCGLLCRFHLSLVFSAHLWSASYLARNNFDVSRKPIGASD